MRRNMAWLDQQPYVERYSWFAALPNGDPNAGSLVTGSGGLTNLGNVFGYSPYG